MFVVGLTGGIGSGKTAASDYFQTIGVTVVDADIASRTVVEPGKPALAEIAAHFGQDVIQDDGQLDRARLRERIFNDEAERKWLEGLLHPLMAEELINGLAAATSDYVILVSPLLFETGQNALCDKTLVIDVPIELQISRTTERDNNTESQVKAIIESQSPRDTRLNKASNVIVNNGPLEQLYRAIDELHPTYIENAKAKAAGQEN